MLVETLEALEKVWQLVKPEIERLEPAERCKACRHLQRKIADLAEQDEAEAQLRGQR
jgi:hypothetical protein